ncbi:Dyp-type peroxidase [Limnoglobus roseus]|uniref:Multifunctional dye peroxidase DyP2 n=1 Tax=Limnoglobus roseus TaxID=2598579 RepID=A0A5C1A4Q4_9BACT|nr:Dyp-type peroxidase [Limnoglobus roseus]QEL13650.1 Multifunctional dye peroxidase DyP2 [Limnoglobus roseus]
MATNAPSVPASPPTVPPAPPVPNIKDGLGDIQGNVIGGFNKDHQTFLFLNFTDTVKARAWVGGIATEVASAAEVAQFDTLFKRVNLRRGGELGVVKATWMNLGFSFKGLEALGVTAADLGRFPDAFRAGMAARKAIIGDVGANDPANWVGPLGKPDVHAILIVAADSQEDLGEHVLRYLHNIGVNGGVRLLYLQDGAVREDEPGHEHFGFRDGVSQPAIRVLDEHRPGMVAPSEPIQANPGQDRLHGGEFVLGYPTQIPQDKSCPNETLAPNPDPGPISPKRGGDEDAPDWAVNGSYLVFRRLAQNVGGFRDHVAALAAAQGLSSEVMGAKLVGRYKSGAPLELTRDEEELMKQGKLSASFDPTTGDPSAEVAAALGLPPGFPRNDGNLSEDSRLDNHFEYGDDADGLKVPLGAHIRKTYPRDDPTPGGGESDTQTHRIMRRGIPFGTSFRPGLGSVGHAGKPGLEEPGDRGLLFLCYQSSISRQFEFIQRNWVHNPNFSKPGTGEDPIISQTPQGDFLLPKTGTQAAHLSIMHFVTMTGGEYFFQPAIGTLVTVLGDPPPAVAVSLPTADDEGDDDDPNFDPCSTAE